MPDDLEKEAEDAADHEHPEHVEEVQGDVAPARSVTAQRAVYLRGSVLVLPQPELKEALLAQRRVGIRLEREQDEHVGERDDQFGAEAPEHEAAYEVDSLESDHDAAEQRRLLMLAAEEPHAQHEEQHGKDDGDQDEDRSHDERGERRMARHLELREVEPVADERDEDEHREHHADDLHDACDDREHAEDADQEGIPLTLMLGSDGLRHIDPPRNG